MPLSPSPSPSSSSSSSSSSSLCAINPFFTASIATIFLLKWSSSDELPLSSLFFSVVCVRWVCESSCCSTYCGSGSSNVRDERTPSGRSMLHLNISILLKLDEVFSYNSRPL
ncbi:hypothetical protein SDJN02_03226, partial [Cucurbita argyrosperma subsp. argyrosperma]